jgi:hypothetical protein
MAVTKKDVQPQAEAPLVRLELVGVKRYVPLDGPLYEAGVIYKFTQEQAKKVMRLTDGDGKPLFDTYKPERHKKVVVLGPQEADMSQESINDITPVSAERLDIGDDDEIRDIIGAEEEGVRV